MSKDLNDNYRTVIPIGPKWADIGNVSVTAGDAVRSKHLCSTCGSVLWVFTLYLWTSEGPMPIYSGPICRPHTAEEESADAEDEVDPTKKEPEE